MHIGDVLLFQEYSLVSFRSSSFPWVGKVRTKDGESRFLESGIVKWKMKKGGEARGSRFSSGAFFVLVGKWKIKKGGEAIR